MFLLAVAPLWPALASLMIGGAIATVVWWVFAALRSDDLQQGDEWRYDVSRINDLRQHDALYRQFHPVINVMAKLNRAAFADSLPRMQQELLAAGHPRLWLPEEYLARMQVQALLITPIYLYLGITYLGMPGIVFALMLSGLTAYLLARRLSAQARYRLVLIKRRMPYLLDLVTLLMEAGSTFFHALRQAVKELQGTEVAVEFGRVQADMNLGKTRRQAFEAMQDRLSDPEVNAIISAIIQGEELGTPLAAVFRTQADVLRLKRSQRAEAIAGEAGVNMLLPMILVMMSTVLIILGPFLLAFYYSGFGL